MKGELTPVQKAAADKLAKECLDVGFEDFKAALEPKVGHLVKYTLWVPPDWVLKGPEKIVDIKREGRKITHVKLADSPCWVPIANLVR